MRVEAAHRDPRTLDEPRQSRVGQIDRLADSHRFHALDRLAQADVSAHVSHRQFRHGQHHREVLGAAQTRDELGVPLEVRPRHPRRLLVHRQRHNARYLACQRVPCRTVDIGQRRRTGLSAQNSGRHVSRTQQPKIADVQRTLHRLLRPINRANRDLQAQRRGRPHQHRHIAIHHGIAAQQPLAKPPHRNLRPNARSIPHRHRHRPPRHNGKSTLPHGNDRQPGAVRGGGPSELGVSDCPHPIINRGRPERTERSEPHPPFQSEKASVRWDPSPGPPQAGVSDARSPPSDVRCLALV